MTKTLIISPWAKIPRNGRHCAKNYPFWNELIKQLNDSYRLIQIGIEGEEKLVGIHEYQFNLKFEKLRDLLLSSYSWISVDNFFHHFAHYYGKKGVVIFSKSDPKIFGYKDNVNLFKDKKYFRNDQFGVWNDVELDIDSFPKPENVIDGLNMLG